MSNETDLQKMELEKLMEQKPFRGFITRLLDESGVGSSGFDDNSGVHAKNAGRRQMGHWVETQLKEATPNGYLLMIKEKLND